MIKYRGSQSVVSNSLETQILASHLTTNQKSRTVHSSLCLTSPLGDSDANKVWKWLVYSRMSESENEQ